MNSRICLKEGTLWQSVLQTTERALQSGSLFPVPTDYEFIEDAGIRFFVRILSSLGKKDEARNIQRESTESGRGMNPFLPYEPGLFVSDISDTHVALLNKFNVVEHHLLIVTRNFEDQENLLTLQDFEALQVCMEEYDSLGFYNGGEAAGASQRHKHLQVVPLPLAPEGPVVPIDPLLSEAGLSPDSSIIPGLPFLHRFVRFQSNPVAGSSHNAAKEIFRLYTDMITQMNLQSPGNDTVKKQSGPYCLIVTRLWMLLVPRSREFFDSISVNSLGFAGALLVRNREQMNLLIQCGPMTALKRVAIPA